MPVYRSCLCTCVFRTCVCIIITTEWKKVISPSGINKVGLLPSSIRLDCLSYPVRYDSKITAKNKNTVQKKYVFKGDCKLGENSKLFMNEIKLNFYNTVQNLYFVYCIYFIYFKWSTFKYTALKCIAFRFGIFSESPSALFYRMRWKFQWQLLTVEVVQRKLPSVVMHQYEI